MTQTTSGFEVRVGCDVQSIDEVRSAIETSGERYLHRILGDRERQEMARLSSSDLIARYAVGRFAAKEAVYKTLRGRPDTALPWTRIEILTDENGAPYVRLGGAAAELATAAGVGDISVSISHAAPFAFAVAAATITAQETQAPSTAPSLGVPVSTPNR
jgi:phosphopantetheine--protein transferase-like protein